MKSSNGVLPYDSIEMLFAFHVSEKARAKRDQYIMQFPPQSREAEKRSYTLERAVKEILADVAEVAVLIKELES